MVFTIHRYIFRDLLKYFLLATAVLSVVLGLGVMLRPLRQFSVDPVNVPTLLLCTLPITLTMVIPIAALLATTLVYGRLAGENEINACRSSGISLLTLIYPAVALALSVGIITLLLGFHIIPYFTRKFERIILTDAQTIIHRNISKTGNLGDMFGNLRIHADQAESQGDRLQLQGVAVVVLDRKKIDEMFTAQYAEVDFDVEKYDHHIAIYLHNAIAIQEEGLVSIGNQVFYHESPSLWRDKIEFKTLDQLKAIRQDMTQFELIRTLTRDIRQQILVERFFAYCDDQLREHHNLVLEKDAVPLRLEAWGAQLHRPTKKKNIRLADKNRTALLLNPPDGMIRLRQTVREKDRQRTKIYRSPLATLTIFTFEEQAYAWLLREETEWTYADEVTPHRPGPVQIPRISLPPELVAETETITWKQLEESESLADVSPLKNPTTYLAGLHRKLKDECTELDTDIRVELHSRLAFGVGCVVLVLLGAALGILFRSSHLLTAFGISFIPAAMCLITIFTGKHIAEANSTHPVGGIVFLWTGIAVVIAANGIIYKTLFKR